MSRSSTVRGVLWMSGAVLSFCAMAIAARELLARMGTFEILFFRTTVAFVIVLALMGRAGSGGWRTARIGVHLWRNAFHFAGQASWVYAIGALSLATVFAIEFTVPIWVAALAAPILGERITRTKVVMLCLGMVGVLVILRPGLGVLHPAALVMLLGSICFAMSMIGTKRLASTDSPLTVLFWMSAIQTPVCLAIALPRWVNPAPADAPWIVAMGLGSFAAHYCLTRSMRLADATVVVPVDFFRLPLIAAVGAGFYGEAFDPYVILGAVIMFAGTYYGVTRERRLARAAAL